MHTLYVILLINVFTLSNVFATSRYNYPNYLGITKLNQNLQINTQSLKPAIKPTLKKKSRLPEVKKKSVRTIGTSTISSKSSSVDLTKLNTLLLKENCIPNTLRRPLREGDTFTPPELLPVAEKLLERIKHKGEGKGIVSSAKKPETLSDELFEAFFDTNRRIVILKDSDIGDLNDLQALALGNDKENFEMRFCSEYPGSYKKRIINAQPQYTLLGKKVAKSTRTKPDKMSAKWIKKLEKGYIEQPNNSKLTELIKKKEILGNKKGPIKIPKITQNMFDVPNSTLRHNKIQDTENQLRNEKTKVPVCTWKYICKNEEDIDTCRLHYSCLNEHLIKSIKEQHKRTLYKIGTRYIETTTKQYKEDFVTKNSTPKLILKDINMINNNGQQNLKEGLNIDEEINKLLLYRAMKLQEGGSQKI